MLDDEDFDTDVEAENEETFELNAGTQMSEQLRIRRAIEDRLEEKRMREEFGLA